MAKLKTITSATFFHILTNIYYSYSYIYYWIFVISKYLFAHFFASDCNTYKALCWCHNITHSFFFLVVGPTQWEKRHPCVLLINVRHEMWSNVYLLAKEILLLHGTYFSFKSKILIWFGYGHLMALLNK